MAENLLQPPRAAAAALQFYPSHDGEAFKFLWPGNEGYSSIVWGIGPFFFPFLFLFSLCMSHTDTGIHFRPLQIHSYFIWYKYCAINPSTAKSFSAKYYFLIQWSKHVLCRGPDLAHPTGRSTISRLACKIVSYTRYTFAKNKYNIYTKQNKPKAFLSELSESAWCGP